MKSWFGQGGDRLGWRDVRAAAASKLGSSAAIVVGIVAFLVLDAVLVSSEFWVARHTIHILNALSTIVFALDVCLLPLAVFRKPRNFCGRAIAFSAPIFGATLLAFSFAVAPEMLGTLAYVLADMSAGLLVPPVLFFAALVRREWIVVLEFVIGILLAFGASLIGTTLVLRSDSREGADVDRWSEEALLEGEQALED